MAVIGTIRRQSGLLIIIIGVALAAFVLGDFLKPRNRSNNTVNIGEVLDEEINYSYFDAKYEENLELQKRNQQKETLSSEEIFRLRQQTFDQIVQNIVLQNEYKKLGLLVSQDELAEKIHGNNPHVYINQVYSTLTNVMGKPEGQYDPTTVIEFMSTIKDRPSNDPYKQWWDKLVLEIKDNHLQNKYKNLITKAYFMPDTFLVSDFNEKKTNAKIRLVGVKQTYLNDSLVKVTDVDLNKYYTDYKQNYKQEASRDLEYVVFDVKPSAQDRQNIREDVADIFEDFKTTENIVLFVNSESDKRYDSTFFKAGELPLQIDSVVFNSEPGTFVEPYIQDNAWHMAKLIETQERPDSMKASHILVAYKGALRAGENITRTKEEAQKIADSLLNVVKRNPATLENLAKQLSDDPSASENSGDLGWFADGQMVYSFNQAVLNNKIGQVTMAESQFGFHIIKVTDKLKAIPKVRVAVIDIEITPSQATFQDAYAVASEFQGSATTAEAFDTLATKFGLSKRSATVQKMSNRIAGIAYPRSIIQWSFIEGIDVGSVSHVFTMEDTYIVAIVTKVMEEGIPEMEEIKDKIEPLVLKDLKLKKLEENMKNALAESQDLNVLAQKFDSKVDTIENVNFNLRNLAGFGNEAAIIAKAFATEIGTLNGPIKGNNAVFFMILDEITPPNPAEDTKMYKTQLIRNFEAKVSNNSYINTLKEKAGIVDNRVLFY
ncbi:MAG: peptidylprolyl isomerase [Bacteroidales bacterium]|nr:peptidylprolyl isomerase [Bacteroidales bacterium]MCF8403074.1 peptidylprolyl isomerase [Bacteroidales bacterium]